MNGNQLLSLENTSCNFPYTANSIGSLVSNGDESNGSCSGGSGSDGVGGNSFSGGGGGGVGLLSTSCPPPSSVLGGANCAVDQKLVAQQAPLDSNLALSVQFHSYSSVNYGGSGGGVGAAPSSVSPNDGVSNYHSTSTTMSSSVVGNSGKLSPAYSGGNKRRLHSVASASSVKSSNSARSDHARARGNSISGGRTRTDSEQSGSSYSRHREVSRNVAFNFILN